MKMAKNIERRLEGMVEGFFAKVFRSGLQPIEVGRRILREMEGGRTVSVNRIYAPNDFRVVMGPDDHKRFSQMESELKREFTELVIEQAKQDRWNLMGMPKITFEEEPDMGKGEFRVEASLTADPDSPAPGVSTHSPPSRDPEATGAISADTASKLGLARAPAELVVLDESGRNKERIAITRTPVVIGRLSSNGVVLSDPNVSRKHAELRRDQEGWVLVDLGSTNGTTVNGRLGREHSLKDGDRLGFGTSELIFRTTGAG
ncbi:MAG: DUF3662 and FHA domain-containing protein [Actinomycetota bacterium]|nr:DUF3662 and FHA domain-containing protein [Actinomycetota bacterium]